jgi:hypothetical protein
MLRCVDRTSVELQFASHASISTDRMLAENHAMFRRLDGECA